MGRAFSTSTLGCRTRIAVATGSPTRTRRASPRRPSGSAKTDSAEQWFSSWTTTTGREPSPEHPFPWSARSIGSWRPHRRNFRRLHQSRMTSRTRRPKTPLWFRKFPHSKKSLEIIPVYATSQGCIQLINQSINQSRNDTFNQSINWDLTSRFIK